MTPNSEQVKAIADEVRRIKFAFDKGDYRIDALEKLALRVEALSTQPTALVSHPASTESHPILFVPQFVTPELLDKNEQPTVTASAEELWKKHSFGNRNFARITGEDGFYAGITEATEQLRRELEEKTVTNGQMSEIINNCERIIRERNAQVSDLTAEVERLKRECFTVAEVKRIADGLADEELVEKLRKAQRGKGAGDQPNAG